MEKYIKVREKKIYYRVTIWEAELDGGYVRRTREYDTLAKTRGYINDTLESVYTFKVKVVKKRRRVTFYKKVGK